MAGIGQLVLFLCGFTLFMVWFVKLMSQYYSLMFGDAQPQDQLLDFETKPGLVRCRLALVAGDEHQPVARGEEK
ncbi:MAG: hypothetical protein WDM76_07360 [Limisphaerales bacterium]